MARRGTVCRKEALSHLGLDTFHLAIFQEAPEMTGHSLLTEQSYCRLTISPLQQIPTSSWSHPPVSTSERWASLSTHRSWAETQVPGTLESWVQLECVVDKLEKKRNLGFKYTYICIYNIHIYIYMIMIMETWSREEKKNELLVLNEQKKSLWWRGWWSGFSLWWATAA